MPPDTRQTVLAEYLQPFPFSISKGGGKTHFVHDDDASCGSGDTYCGRFTVACAYPRSALDVLNAARNPCALCLRRLDDSIVRTVALMASANSQHEITPSDIHDTNE